MSFMGRGNSERALVTSTLANSKMEFFQEKARIGGRTQSYFTLASSGLVFSMAKAFFKINLVCTKVNLGKE